MPVRMKTALSVICVFSLCLSGALRGQDLDEPGVASGYIEMEGGKVFYDVTGTGPDMILIHDGLVHHEVWDGQVPFFARDYRVIRYDRRGYGKSPRAEERYSDIEDLNAVFNHFGVATATLVGMSAGGRLAMDFTLEYPEKVSRLVLVGAVVSGYGFTQHFYTRGGRLSAADYADPDKMLTYWAAEDPYEVVRENEAASLELQEIVAANPQNTDLSKGRMIIPPERPALGRLDEISIPALVLVGEFDIPDVHAHAGVIEAGIDRAQRVLIPDAAHLVPFEKPEEFNRQVGLFIKETTFLDILESGGAAAAIAAIREARAKDPDAVLFREAKINVMGYQEIQAGNLDRAVDLFRLNVIAFPESWNAYDSLGEGYAAKGEVDLAIENYEKSLELNPENANASDWLSRLRAE